MKYRDLPIADSHIHIDWNMPLRDKMELLEKIIEKNNYDTVTICPVPYVHDRITHCFDLTTNLSAFYAKCKMPGRVYAFMGLTHHYDESLNTPEFYLEQLKFYMDAGFDGIKMLEGRTGEHKMYGTGVDDPKYDLFYKYAEDNEIVIVSHIGGPEGAWHEGGSLYGTHPDLNDLYKEVDNVLTKFPKLKMTLAHFYFITEHIEKAAEFLDKWENVYFDLTPNQFMYLDFQKKPEEWKEFFLKYQDRIVYGTDIGSNTTDTDGKEADELVHMVRGFFEEDKPFTVLGYDLTPIPLDDDILKKFYKENMMKLYGNKAPKEPNRRLMKKEYDEVCKRKLYLEIGDRKNLDLIKELFE